MSECPECVKLNNNLSLVTEDLKKAMMVLSTIRVLVMRTNPVCSEKFLKLIESCEECKEEVNA